MTTSTLEHAPAPVVQDDELPGLTPPTLADARSFAYLVQVVTGDRKGGAVRDAKVTATATGWRVKGTTALVALAGRDRVDVVLGKATTRVVITDPGDELLRLVQLVLECPDVSRVALVLRRTKASLFLDVDASAYGQREAKAKATPRHWTPDAGTLVTLTGGELDGATVQVWCVLADWSVVGIVDDGTQRPVSVREDGTWDRYESVAWDRWDEHWQGAPAEDAEPVQRSSWNAAGLRAHEVGMAPWLRAAGLPLPATVVTYLDDGGVIVNGVHLVRVKNGRSPYFTGGEDYAAAGLHGLSDGSSYYSRDKRVSFREPADAVVLSTAAHYADQTRQREDDYLLWDLERAERRCPDGAEYAALWAELDRRTTPDEQTGALA